MQMLKKPIIRMNTPETPASANHIKEQEHEDEILASDSEDCTPKNNSNTVPDIK